MKARGRAGRGWVWLAGVLLAGCGMGGDAASARSVADTLASGRIVITHPDPAELGWAPEAVVEALRIGRVDGPGPDVFGRISGVDMDADGRIYVAESMAREVRVFDPDGGHVFSVGRGGAGPGELGTLSGIGIAPDGTLLVMDPLHFRLTRFDREGGLIDTSPTTSSRMFATIPWSGKVDGLGRLHDVGPKDDAPTAGRAPLVVTRTAEGAHPASQPEDSLALPLPDVRTYEQQLGEIQARGSVPFSPDAHWAPAAADGLWMTSDPELAVHLVNFRGDTLRSVSVRRGRKPVSRAQRDSAAAATGLAPEELPTAHPAIGRLLTDARGRVWIASRQTSPEERVDWIVLDPEGRLIGWVRLEVPITIRAVNPVIRGDRVVGVVFDERGVPFVSISEEVGVPGEAL